MTTFLQIMALLSAFAILAKLEPLVNKMGPHCRPSIRLSVVLILAGAAWLILLVVQGYKPNPATACIAAGLALWLWTDKRKRNCK